jgi:hypothetical protein
MEIGQVDVQGLAAICRDCEKNNVTVVMMRSLEGVDDQGDGWLYTDSLEEGIGSRRRTVDGLTLSCGTTP